eukprot:389617-Lingulodinium_polyedra.AAC.1
MEAGDDWPEELLQTEVPFLPLGRRLLFILPAIYRLWAALRQRQLRGRVDERALPEMFAGVKG